MKSSKLKPVDLNLFKTFAAVHKLRNLTHAGEALATSQPAVSRSLERLNHLFKERLFHRIEGEMRPTRTAEMIAPYILEGLSLLETAVATTEGLNPATLDVTFKLGGNDYVSAVIFPSLVDLLQRRAPNVFLTSIPCSYAEAGQMIQRCTIDCAITSSLPDGERVGAQPLFREDYVCIAASEHPLLAERVDIDLATYVSCDHVLVSYSGSKNGWVDELLAEMGQKRRVVGSTHMFLSIPQIICKQPYLCTLPRRLARQFQSAYPIRIFELPFASKSHLFHLIWPRQQSNNPVFIWLREHIIEICEELDCVPAEPLTT